MTVLNNALNDFLFRNAKQKSELEELKTITTKAIKQSSITKDDILQALSDDISTLNSLQFEKGVDPYPLVSNKLIFLLKGAQIMAEMNWEQISQGVYNFMPNDPDITSMPNYLQTLMLEILAVIRNASITQIPDLQQVKIYDINYSPNIQGVKAANNNTLSSVTESKWRWSTDDKGYNELIVPARAYYFGGSRYDQSYNDKQFKQHDCSSSVATWLDLSPESITTFSTSSLKNLDGELKQILKPIGEDRPPNKGDIFFYPGHCGVVTKYEYHQFEVMSNSRIMPFLEGLMFQQYSQAENGKVVVLDPKCLEREWLCPYHGLDSQLPELKQEDLQYFEHIEC